ncbi:hypothetical protein ESO86_05665, partial [Agromyces binzhouensis]
MSSTTPGSEPDRPAADDRSATDATDASTDAASGDDIAAEQAQVDPTAPDAEHVDRVEPPAVAPEPAASGEEHDFTGTQGAEEPTSAEASAPVAPTQAETADERSELDAAVERARTDHPPVADETTAIDEHPEPVRAEAVRRETGVPETVGAT